jgi:hypothetical protein
MIVRNLNVAISDQPNTRIANIPDQVSDWAEISYPVKKQAFPPKPVFHHLDRHGIWLIRDGSRWVALN